MRGQILGRIKSSVSHETVIGNEAGQCIETSQDGVGELPEHGSRGARKQSLLYSSLRFGREMPWSLSYRAVVPGWTLDDRYNSPSTPDLDLQDPGCSQISGVTSSSC